MHRSVVSTSRSVAVDSFRKRNSSDEFEYVKIRSVSEESSQFIRKKFLSNVLDSRTLRHVRTFKNANMEAGDMVVLEFGKVLILKMLKTRLLALDNKEKMETIERRLDLVEFLKEDVPMRSEEAMRDIYGTGKRGLKRPRSSKQSLRDRAATNRRRQQETEQRFPKRAAKGRRMNVLKY